METFSALLAICAGNSPVPGEFPTQRPVTRSFDVYFDLCPNERLSKQSWGWWFETLSSPLWRHRNVESCSCHDIETPATSLAFCEGNLQMKSWFPFQRSFYVLLLLATKVFWTNSQVTTTPMWRYFNLMRNELLLLIRINLPAWISNHMPINCGVRLLMHSIPKAH